MPVTIRFDPFATVIAAFEALWPDKGCEVYFAEETNAPADAHGATIFPDDGSMPQIWISPELPLEGAVEVLAHELAHVAAGPTDEHGPAWEAAFEALYRGYCEHLEAAGLSLDRPEGTRLQ